MKTHIKTVGCCLLFAASLHAQIDNQAEYFFDADPGPGNGIPLTITPGASVNESATIDISSLSLGVHQWYVRVRQNGVWGFYGERRSIWIYDPTTAPAPTASDIEAAEYFFDADPGPGNGTPLSITPGGTLNESAMIDITGLGLGVHHWYVRTRQNGVWGFYGERRTIWIWDPSAVPSPTVTDIEAAEYFFDADPGPGNGIPLSITPGGTINQNSVIDITGLSVGVHDWYVRTRQNGVWGFYGERRSLWVWDPGDIPSTTATDIEAAEYFFDNDPGVGNGTPIPVSPGGTLSENLLVDISTLSVGTHYWNVRVKQNGTWGFYGEQKEFVICPEDLDPVIAFTLSGSCTSGTFTVDVSMPAGWVGDPFWVINNNNAQTDTLAAGESATFGPFDTGTDLLFTSGSSTDPLGCTKQYRALLSCWYEDSDNDTFGDPNSSVVAVDQPAGYVSDASDLCPTDPLKIAPLICGCGVEDIPTTWYEDLDGDGFGDPAVSQSGYTCIQPSGFVEDSSDDCPNIFGLLGDTCDDLNIYTINDSIDATCTCVGTPSTVVAARVFLDGPYDPTSGRMSDSLRSLIDFPLTDPYPGLGYVHVGTGNDGMLAPAVLATTGDDAIVDWVVLELRDGVSSDVIVASRSALLQRDGDIVDIDGSSPVEFEVIGGDLHVAVRHRNHLGVMTQNTLALSPTSTAIDLSIPGTPVFGTSARKSIVGAFPAEVLWAGDVNYDGSLKYVGASNDRDPILVEIGGSIPTNSTFGYRSEDVNMDGEVKYVGAGNDRDVILINIGGSVPTNVVIEQLP